MATIFIYCVFWYNIFYIISWIDLQRDYKNYSSGTKNHRQTIKRNGQFISQSNLVINAPLSVIQYFDYKRLTNKISQMHSCNINTVILIDLKIRYLYIFLLFFFTKLRVLILIILYLFREKKYQMENFFETNISIFYQTMLFTNVCLDLIA